MPEELQIEGFSKAWSLERHLDKGRIWYWVGLGYGIVLGFGLGLYYGKDFAFYEGLVRA